MVSPQSLALCLDPPGDINGDGHTTVVDVQCALLTVLGTLLADDPPPAFCAAQPGGADMDCDGIVTVGDAMLVIHFTLKTPLPVAIDENGDQCADGCATECGDGVCNTNASENCWLCPTDCSCDDKNPCTLDNCDPVSGQCFWTLSLGPCDDGDPCTDNDQCGAQGCVGATNICPDTTCTPVSASVAGQYTVGCTFWGNKGDVVDCDLLLYRTSPSAYLPIGFQVYIAFEKPLHFISIYGTFCTGGPVCALCDVFGKKLAGGHDVSPGPPTQEAWNPDECPAPANLLCSSGQSAECVDPPCGFGGLIVATLTDLWQEITSAYLAPDGSMVGNPKVVTLRFQLDSDTDVSDPAKVIFANVVVTDASAVLPSTVIQNQIVVFPKK
ncbi:MAG: hypothetical protein HUU55_09235 [Myxococcales bacterium]|nr:hypothetical protein [Myxococcales bacterium]